MVANRRVRVRPGSGDPCDVPAAARGGAVTQSVSSTSTGA